MPLYLNPLLHKNDCLGGSEFYLIESFEFACSKYLIPTAQICQLNCSRMEISFLCLTILSKALFFKDDM